MLNAIRYTFKAYERLKREQHIHTLFQSGKAFSVFPLRVIYHFTAATSPASPVQVGFSIPKKKFRSSVHRHRIRRLMFEAWRLHKQVLYPAIPAGLQLHVFVIFTDTTHPTLDIVTQSMITALEKLQQLASKAVAPPAENQETKSDA